MYTGTYGELSQLGAGNAILIIMQLTFSGYVIIMLDEMMTKVNIKNRDMVWGVPSLYLLLPTYAKVLYGILFHP